MGMGGKSVYIASIGGGEALDTSLHNHESGVGFPGNTGPRIIMLLTYVCIISFDETKSSIYIRLIGPCT